MWNWLVNFKLFVYITFFYLYLSLTLCHFISLTLSLTFSLTLSLCLSLLSFYYVTFALLFSPILPPFFLFTEAFLFDYILTFFSFKYSHHIFLCSSFPSFLHSLPFILPSFLPSLILVLKMVYTNICILIITFIIQ